MNSATILVDRADVTIATPATPIPNSMALPRHLEHIPLSDSSELLGWLYSVVERNRAQFRFSSGPDAEQRWVGNLLRRIFSQLPESQSQVLECIELGGDTLETFAGARALDLSSAKQLLRDARMAFLTEFNLQLLRFACLRPENPVSLT